MIKELEEKKIEHYQYVQKLSQLDLIKNDKVNIAIYEREINNDLEAYLKQLIDLDFKSLNIVTTIDKFESLFDDHFKTLSPKNVLGHQLLRNDIKQLLNQFSEISNNSNLKVFLGLVDTDMCRRFHVDVYELRMLCTYQGQGTMWLTDDNINSTALSNYEGNEKIVLRENDAKQLNTYDVGIIKGALYPNSIVGGLVHRSPTIENLNQKRIVLRIDSKSLLDSI